MRGLHVVINETSHIRAGHRKACSLQLSLSLNEDPAVPPDLRNAMMFRVSGIVEEDGAFKRLTVWDSRTLVVGDSIKFDVIDSEDFDPAPQMIDTSTDRLPSFSMDIFLLRFAIAQFIRNGIRRILIGVGGRRRP